jgi:hypothetical protein
MQQWMQYFLSTDDPNPADLDKALVDFGFFHNVKDVKRMYAEYVNNKRYGYKGAVLDQPDEYWEDMSTMHLIKLWVESRKGVFHMEQVDVIDQLRKTGRLQGKFKQ